MNRVGYIAQLVLGGCFLLEATAQTRFNERYSTFGVFGAAEAWSVVELPDTTYLAVCSTPWIDPVLSWYYSSVVTMIRVDAEGNQLSIAHFNVPYSATYPGWSNSAFLLSDGSVMVGGSTFEEDGSDEISRPALFHISAEGLPIGQWIYGAPNEDLIGRQAKQAPDGGFVICGETSQPGPINNGSQLDAFVLKTDAQGNQEWLQTYGANNRFEFVNSIGLTDDGGYFLGGTVSTTSLLVNDRMVLKINAQGAVQWTRSWGTVQSDGPALVTTAADGHVLVAGSKGNSPDWPYRSYLAKLDKNNGSTIWERAYGDPLSTDGYFMVVQEITPGGDLITGGSTLTSEPVLGIMYRGSLLRTTNTGDSLWMRYYDYYDANVSDGRGYFRDVQPTSDGGFIAVGQALPVGPYTSDVWVVKTDGHGCIEPGCQLITGLETQITNLRGALSVAPNPVAQGATVQVSIALPENFIPQGALRITVTDAMGRVVHEQLIGEAGHSELRGTKQEGVPASLTATQLPSGLYHLHLHDATRWVSGAKLVVE